CVYYARSRPCDHDFQIASYFVQSLRIDASEDHPIAVGADSLERASGVAGLNAVGNLAGRHLRPAARQAVEPARTAHLPRSRAPIGKKVAEFLASNQSPALVVDRL